jgi:hypothetical protein
MGRLDRGEMVAVSTNVLAQRKTREVAAIVAATAEDIGAHDDPISDTQLLAVIFQESSGPPADFRNSADNLMTWNDRERR